MVGGGKSLAHVRMDAVYQNALRHPLDGGQVLGRVALPFQILFYAKSCVGFGYFIMNGSVHCISPINSIKYNRCSACWYTTFGRVSYHTIFGNVQKDKFV
jgi:hypothetical protein